VTKQYRTVEEYLLFSDLDCVSFVYDGTHIYTEKRALRALECGYNLVKSISIELE
jgi:hypothetical protein